MTRFSRRTRSRTVRRKLKKDKLNLTCRSGGIRTRMECLRRGRRILRTSVQCVTKVKNGRGRTVTVVVYMYETRGSGECCFCISLYFSRRSAMD